jgi:integrase
LIVSALEGDPDMPTLKTVVDGFVCQQEFDNATLGRLAWWVDQLGDKELAEITADEVDAALVRLAERGKLRAGRGLKAEPLGKPLAASTFNRYAAQLASVFKYARRLRLVPRAFVPPTRGVEKAPEDPHHDRYFRPDEVERLAKVARLVDRKWGRLEALIITAYHTGLRKSDVLGLRWRDVDLEARTVSVLKTKNGDPMVSALSQRAAALLNKIPDRKPDALLFPGKKGQPYDIRRLWSKVCAEANITNRTFHSLRHGCGHALAQAGTNQAVIMKIMGHRSFAGSARYMHADASDKRRVVDSVFSE